MRYSPTSERTCPSNQEMTDKMSLYTVLSGVIVAVWMVGMALHIGAAVHVLLLLAVGLLIMHFVEKKLA